MPDRKVPERAGHFGKAARIRWTEDTAGIVRGMGLGTPSADPRLAPDGEFSIFLRAQKS